MTLPQGRDGLSARRMAVLWTFREPSLCRHVHRALLRKAALNLTLIIPATACHQRNYVERYSRFMVKDSKKYAATGGWGFAQFNKDGKPADEAMHNTCFSCHEPAKARDFVFTHYAP